MKKLFILTLILSSMSAMASEKKCQKALVSHYKKLNEIRVQLKNSEINDNEYLEALEGSEASLSKKCEDVSESRREELDEKAFLKVYY